MVVIHYIVIIVHGYTHGWLIMLNERSIYHFLPIFLKSMSAVVTKVNHSE